MRIYFFFIIVKKNSRKIKVTTNHRIKSKNEEILIVFTKKLKSGNFSGIFHILRLTETGIKPKITK